MRFLVLYKIVNNNSAFIVADSISTDALMTDGWSFFLTNSGMGYDSREEAFDRLAAYHRG